MEIGNLNPLNLKQKNLNMEGLVFGFGPKNQISVKQPDGVKPVEQAEKSENQKQSTNPSPVEGHKGNSKPVLDAQTTNTNTKGTAKIDLTA